MRCSKCHQPILFGEPYGKTYWISTEGKETIIFRHLPCMPPVLPITIEVDQESK